MAGTILTPTLIWKGFNVENDFNEQVIAGTNDESFSVRNLTLKGRTTKDGAVKIFATVVKSENKKIQNAILYLPDLGEQPDEKVVKDLANHGYIVMTVDVCGKKDDLQYYTEYPDSIAYANYENAKSNLYAVPGDANRTCWYEWACVLRYGLAYLKSLPEVKKVGGLAVGESATALWQVAGMDKDLDVAVFTLNAGWIGYRGTDKFGGQVEPQFSDEMLKFVAGIEPQSYAMHVTCPVLVLSATNSNKFDCDRVYDTLTHINEEVYSTVNYSVGHVNSVNAQAFETAKIFFDNFLNKAKPMALPSYIDIKSDCVDGKIKFSIEGEVSGIKDVAVFVAEETTKPSNRCWKKLNDYEKDSETGELVFEFSPFSHSETVIAFAQATYKNGFTMGSKVIAKRFCEKEVNLAYKSNVIYSSRNQNAESVFVSAMQSASKFGKIETADEPCVEIKKGPMGISGAYCANGLLTFKINAKTDRPSEGAMLMFDLYAKNKGANCVKLIADYFGEKIEYFAWFNVLGGEVWQNVQIEQNKFKTEQGMSLKSFEKIDALEFVAGDGEYIINNALWV